jgi:porin
MHPLDILRRALAGAVLTAGGLAGAGSAWAEDDAPPAWTMRIKDTTDLWRNVSGGARVGYTTLNKLQFSATLDGDALDHPGFKAHVHVFKTNGETLSLSRTGDIQTASNIEALSVTRLFELWVEQDFGEKGRGVSARAGLMDLNETFDSIDAASIFTNSSHGIAPDLSRSGRNGPSIFPVTSVGVQLGWSPSPALSAHLAAFDGVPGNPAHPKAFATIRLSREDGALLIGQADYKFAPDAQVSLGLWGYTTSRPDLTAPGAERRARPGAYAFVEGPAPGLAKARAWVRAGVADGRSQAVSAYVGGGLVWKGLLTGRDDDQFGIAVARAMIGAPARRAGGLPAAETTWEATYSFKVREGLNLQPDVQYIIHPSGAVGQKDALAVGLRIVVALKWPTRSPEDDN